MRLNSKKAKHLRAIAREQISGVDSIKWFNGYQFNNALRPNQQNTFKIINTLINMSKVEITQDKIKDILEDAKAYIFPPLMVKEPSGKALYRKLKRSFKRG